MILRHSALWAVACLLLWPVGQAGATGPLRSGEGTEAVADGPPEQAPPAVHAAKVLRSDRGMPPSRRQEAPSAPPPQIQPVIVPQISLPAGVTVPAPRAGAPANANVNAGANGGANANANSNAKANANGNASPATPAGSAPLAPPR